MGEAGEGMKRESLRGGEGGESSGVGVGGPRSTELSCLGPHICQL